MGYRRIPGSSCKNDLAGKVPVLAECTFDDKLHVSDGAAVTVIVIIFVLLSVAAVASVVLYKTNTRFSAFVASLRIPGLTGNKNVVNAANIAPGALDDGLLDDSSDTDSNAV